MALSLNYKGFSFEDAISPKTPQQSVKLAKNSLYHAWFEVMKRAPWYLQKLERGVESRTVSDQLVFEFGDIRDLKFDQWWLDRGYQIFSETVPYETVENLEDQFVQAITPTGNLAKRLQHDSLVLEIPLNLSWEVLRQQVQRAVEIAQNDLSRRRAHALDRELRPNADFNPHLHSTAQVKLYANNRLDAKSILANMKFYDSYLAYRAKTGKDYKHYNFCRDSGEAPQLLPPVIKNSKREVPQQLRTEAAAVITGKLRSIYSLMAHACQSRFPCNDRHDWASLGRINQEFLDNKTGKFNYNTNLFLAESHVDIVDVDE